MSNKKRSQKNHRSDQDQDDNEDAAPENEFSVEDQVKEWFEKAQDKRATVRLDALKNLRKTLSNGFSVDVFINYVETGVGTLLSCISKGSKEEARAALVVLQILCFTIADESLQLIDEEQVLRIRSVVGQRLLSDRTQDAKEEGGSELCAELIATLCVWLFVRESVQSLLHSKGDGSLDFIVKNYWINQDPLVVATAIRGCSLLCTLIPPGPRVELLIPRLKGLLMENLSHASIDVRLAAGELLCLLYESYHLIREEDETLEDDQLEDIVEMVKQCVGENSKNISKKDKTKQRLAFREWLKTIETGDEPYEKVVIKKITVEFNEWSSIVQLNRVRDIFGEGLVAQLEGNGIVRAILNLEQVSFDEPAVKLTSQQKRLLLSKNSAAKKKKSIELSNLRRQFADFLINDG